MKKILLIFGTSCLILIIVAAYFIGYGLYQGQGLDESSKEYVEANVPPIVSTWSKEELLKRSSPELLQVLNQKPGEIDQIFLKLSRLGILNSFGDVKGEAKLDYTTNKGKVITASYVATAKFEHGEGQITVFLIQQSGQWQFLSFNVNSPLFLQ